MLVSPKHVELDVQEAGSEKPNPFQHFPKNGDYLLVVDAIPQGPHRTKVTLYHGPWPKPIFRAVKDWATGESLGCPDLAKN